jgi:aminopeptidase-like protein
MAQDRLAELSDGLLSGEIDSGFKDGSLTYGEYLHCGQTDWEFIQSAYLPASHHGPMTIVPGWRCLRPLPAASDPD